MSIRHRLWPRNVHRHVSSLAMRRVRHIHNLLAISWGIHIGNESCRYVLAVLLRDSIAHRIRVVVATLGLLHRCLLNLLAQDAPHVLMMAVVGVESLL